MGFTTTGKYRFKEDNETFETITQKGKKRLINIICFLALLGLSLSLGFELNNQNLTLIQYDLVFIILFSATLAFNNLGKESIAQFSLAITSAMAIFLGDASYSFMLDIQLMTAFPVSLVYIFFLANNRKLFHISLVLILGIYFLHAYLHHQHLTKISTYKEVTLAYSLFSSAFFFAGYLLLLSFFHRSLKKAHQKLISSEQRFKIITKNIKDGITVADLEGNYTFVNPAFCEMSGYSNDELLQLSIYDMKADSNGPNVVFPDAIKNGSAQNDCIPLRRKDGTVYYCSVSGQRITIGNRLQVLGVVRDVTEQILNERRLKETIQTKEKFFSIIAHDLRSPFSTLIGFSDLLVDEEYDLDSDEIKDIIHSIHTTSKNTFDLLENLLAWSRTELGQISFKPETVNLGLFIRQTINPMKSTARGKDIKLHSQINNSITVNCDKNMMHSIIRNLVSNALKFTPRGGEVKIYCENFENHIRLCVRDTGVGIAEEKIPHLFNISKNHTTEGTEREKGSGLGLVLCKEFVEKHGGEIKVISTIGKGSIFCFTLPNN